MGYGAKSEKSYSRWHIYSAGCPILYIDTKMNSIECDLPVIF